MPTCHFFALPTDVFEILADVCAQPTWSLTESYSTPGTLLRTFTTLDELRLAYSSWRGTLLLDVYSPVCGGRRGVRRIDLKSDEYAAAPWREATDGWGLINLQFPAPHSDRLQAARVAHTSEARARKWEPRYPEMGAVDDWSWKGVEQIAGKIARMIRRRTVSKHGTRPVLRAAHDAVQSGELTLEP